MNLYCSVLDDSDGVTVGGDHEIESEGSFVAK